MQPVDEVSNDCGSGDFGIELSETRDREDLAVVDSHNGCVGACPQLAESVSPVRSS
jgi:hypothetical protein